jgi:50S ribosomal subunit-associated GTPase HflX
MTNKLAIIPVINKIDFPGAEIEDTKAQIEHALALDASDALLVSAKRGTGIFEVAIQASIGSRIIARENVPPMRKNVLVRRRRHPQTQAPGKTERRQAAHETRRPRRYPPKSLARCAESQRAVAAVYDRRFERGSAERSPYLYT